jgi:mRNA interferase RelE/StbE
MYKIFIGKKTRKKIDRLPTDVRYRIESKIEELAFDPKPNGFVKLSGYADTYRIRIGDYRIIYSIDDDEIMIIIENAAHRKDVYKE